MRSCK